MAEAQVLPTGPRWWWIVVCTGAEPDPVRVARDENGTLWALKDGWHRVEKLAGQWREPVLTPAEVAALTAERAAAIRERDEVRAALARIYVESGADPDGNDPAAENGIAHLWPKAEAAVRELRQHYDEAIAGDVERGEP